MNEFVGREWNRMAKFLNQISSCNYNSSGALVKDGGGIGKSFYTATDEDIDAEIDLGRELSLLHSYLAEAWTPQVGEQ
jgi:hypothetical protein